MSATLPLTAGALLAASALAQAPDAKVGDDLVVTMQPCEKKRSVETGYVRSSRNLVLHGQVDVDGTKFDIYLPRDKKNAYSIAPRPKRQQLLTRLTSTHLSVDQNHDGKISRWENYFAEFPLRIGDTMFDVRAIAKDGSTITLRRSRAPLTGAVLGAPASDVTFTTVDGKRLRPADLLGKVLVFDVWAPS